MQKEEKEIMDILIKDVIKEHLLDFKKSIEALGGKFKNFTIDRVATQQELDNIESILKRPLPDDLKVFALTVSRKIIFDWYLPEEFKLPKNLDEIFSGGLNYDISEIINHEKAREGWQKECFPNPNDSYDVIWHNKLAFHSVSNGDFLAFDPAGRVIYLSHDDGEGHGYIIANSFSDLISRWIPLGCPGPEDWQWLPFVSDSASGIIADSDVAKQWLSIIGKGH